MKALDRLIDLIRDFNDEARMCQDKIDDWTALRDSAGAHVTEDLAQIIGLWQDRKNVALEVAAMLTETKGRAEASGMTATVAEALPEPQLPDTPVDTGTPDEPLEPDE